MISKCYKCNKTISSEFIVVYPYEDRCCFECMSKILHYDVDNENLIFCSESYVGKPKVYKSFFDYFCENMENYKVGVFWSVYPSMPYARVKDLIIDNMPQLAIQNRPMENYEDIYKRCSLKTFECYTKKSVSTNYFDEIYHAATFGNVDILNYILPKITGPLNEMEIANIDSCIKNTTNEDIKNILNTMKK